jgi:very-short-patch-repair endonuclease
MTTTRLISPNGLTDLVKQRLENLRPKLLDLSKRNPLISTKLVPRSNSHIRIVDELPDILFYKINNGGAMRVSALPAIDDDPPDEQTGSFREALINARLTDRQYLSEMESVDRDADDYVDRTRQIERSLKDRIREALQLPPRTAKSEVSLVEHAKLHGIAPSYELPNSDRSHIEARHSDDRIQTLLLPGDLERKLNAITSKCRTWLQETGINVLHIAYGFLEWSGDRTETAYSPLILCEAKIEKRRTSQGIAFSISGAGEDPALNAVLAEKLRLDFGIALPAFSGASVEEYFAKVGELSPPNMAWRIRRQVAIGVFPSARMAMYHDLDTSQPDFPESEIVQSLLGGRDGDGDPPYAEEYEVDQPAIEAKVPYIVLDADSSQFSALVDIAEGRNLAVEGPPGTGKSQTIVNAIAAALADGKKVLFVAEKLAALNVVKSRLEAVGLGEFVLPLQAERSTREQVIASVRERMAMPKEGAVRDYDDKLDDYRRTRRQLAKYVELLIRPFGESGLTIREILSKTIATTRGLAGVAPETLERCNTPEGFLTRPGLKQLRKAGANIEEAYRIIAGSNSPWKETRLDHPERFTIEEACDLAARASRAFSSVAHTREGLAGIGIAAEGSAALAHIDAHLQAVDAYVEAYGAALMTALLTGQNAEAVRSFLERCEEHEREGDALSRVLAVPPDDNCIEMIAGVTAICERLSLSTIDLDSLADELQRCREAMSAVRSFTAVLAPLVSRRPGSRTWLLGDIATARSLFEEAGGDALLRRNAWMNEPDATRRLSHMCAEGRRLQAQKAKLANRVSFAAEVPIEALAECVATLRAAGRFSFLSSQYRAARRLFLSVARAARFDRPAAIETLEALIRFRGQEAEFNRRPHVRAAFGLHFRGADTELEPFERLAKFYAQVDAHFGSPDRTSLRAFLRDADLAELELLRSIPPNQIAVTYELLQERLAADEVRAGNLEEAIAALHPYVHVFVDTKTIDPGELQQLAGRIRAFIAKARALDEHHDVRPVLGGAFQGSQTAWRALADVVGWAVETRPVREMISAVLTRNEIARARSLIGEVLSEEQKAQELIQRLSSKAKIDGRHFTEGRSVPEIAQVLDRAALDADGLFRHAVFAGVLDEARPLGLAPLVEDRMQRGENLVSLADQFEAVAIRQLAKAVFATTGELSRYRGSKLDGLRAAFADQDRDIIRLSRRKLRAKLCAAARPPRGNGIGRKSTWTEMALLENETGKTQRFISVRDLTHRAGRALQELKPCWMMSPLAVAQYVPKGTLHFDLCIIDEASQMPPESAIGALLRCGQTIVVGDTNQLPPTSFFKAMIDDEEADEDETIVNESILEMANATFRPARRLRWHYRSRHSGLIKFSNHLVYDGDLVVFPSAAESASGMGVELRRVTGAYKAGTNPLEAKAVVEAAIAFMQADPERSLGIVTLNQKQRDLISEEFEYALASNPDAVRYVESWKERNDGLEDFFIKNLENVQGDERDVIFIGTVYGPEEPGGRVMQRFGPINGVAGKRRLNVLFTRAKQKIVTFSSMTAADILADENGNPGAYMLKRWLEYSASGVLEGGGRPKPPEPDSDFEVFVMSQIRSMGCEAVPQVGVAGYFIDIGVRHPDWPYGYILGVECDGAAYHSAKSARDRDRLRQEVLEGLGWRLHRIWSTDWFNHPNWEAEKLRELIASRINELKSRAGNDAAAPPEPGQSALQPPSGKSQSEKPESKDIRFPAAADRRGEGAPPASTPPVRDRGIAVGDTVRVRYLAGDRNTLQITISETNSDPSQGIVRRDMPIARALLGAEQGDEVEVLIGSYVRRAVVERIFKNSDAGPSSTGI